MNLKSRYIFLLLATCLLAACGFTLRGSANLPEQLQTLVLVSTNGNTEISREMRRALIASDITLLDAPEAGVYSLVLGDADSNERVLSVNTNARAGEYELNVSVPFQLRYSSSIVLGPETVSTEKVYLADPNRAVAKAEERDLMEEEMRRELVNQILRRLQSASL